MKLLKQCSQCRQYFPPTIEFFCKETRRKTGIGPMCIPCKQALNHKNYMGNRDTIQSKKSTPEALQHRREVYKGKQEIVRAQDTERARNRVPKIPTQKRCRKCRKVKRSSQFGRTNRHNDGLRSYCKDCHNADNRQYARTHHAVYETSRVKRRAKRKGATKTEKITLIGLAIRDNWTCHLCHKKVTRKNWSRDHLVPLSRGGDHTWLNVALAHRLCNTRRWAGLIPAQMRLLGDLTPYADLELPLLENPRALESPVDTYISPEGEDAQIFQRLP